MPLTRKRATLWTASDGKTFEDFTEAAQYEHEQQVYSRLIEIFGPDLDWSSQELIHKLLEYREEIGKLFTKTRTAFRREARPANVEISGGAK